MGRLDTKTAVVTGGARGIGRAICRMFAEEGARVAVTDIIDDEGQALAATINGTGGIAGYWHLDTSQAPDVARVMADVVDQWGRLDILVNNAGIAGPNQPTHQIDPEAWDQVIRINVNGVFLCTKHAVPHMRNGDGGSIINLSSIYGLVGAADLPPYHASKGAVRLMTKTDALLYAGDRIRVNSIHPGYIWTPLVADLAESSGEEASHRPCRRARGYRLRRRLSGLGRSQIRHGQRTGDRRRLHGPVTPFLRCHHRAGRQRRR